MTVINIQSGLSAVKAFFAKMGWTYEPFRQLTAQKRTEVLIFKQGFRIYKKSNLESALDFEVSPISDLESTCAHLIPGEKVVLCVDQDLCFAHRIEVPSAALSKLDSIVKFEVARVTPFVQGQIFLGYYENQPNRTIGKTEISILVIRREIIEQVAAAIQKLGAEAIAITARNGKNISFPFALARDGTLFEVARFRLWFKIFGLSFSTVLIAGFLAASSVWKYQYNQEKVVAMQISNLEKDAAKVRVEIDASNERRDVLSALQNRRLTLHNRNSLIEEMSKLLPDDTFLESLGVDGSTVKIDGASPNPESLIQTLENSKRFQSVVFVSPSFRNPGETRSRFSIRLELESVGKD